MNHEQPRGGTVGPPNGRNARKRPRISLAGLQVRAPPELQFHKPPVPSPESSIVFHFSRKPSWEDLSKRGADGATNDLVGKSDVLQGDVRHHTTNSNDGQNPSSLAGSSAIPITAAPANENRNIKSSTQTETVGDTSSDNIGRETGLSHSNQADGAEDLPGDPDTFPNSAPKLTSLSPSTMQVSDFVTEAVAVSQTIDIATPELRTPIDDKENSEPCENNQASATASSLEERVLLARLERSINLAEEEDLLNRLDHDILLAEEEAVLKRLEDDIQKAEAAAISMEIEVPSHTNISKVPSKDNQTNTSVNGQSTEKLFAFHETHNGFQEHISKTIDLPSVDEGETSRQSDSSSCNMETVPTANRVVGYLKESLNRKVKNGGLTFSEDDFKSIFMSGFRREVEREDPSNLVDFEYTIQPSPKNKLFVYDLVAKGESSVIAALKSKVKVWVKYRAMLAKINQVTNDGESKVVDILARPEQFGIKIKTFDLSKDLLHYNESGAFFETCLPPGRFTQMLGPKAAKIGAVIIAADNMSIGNTSDLQEYLREKEVEGAFVKLTFCLHNKTDLSQGSVSKVSIRRMRDEKRPSQTLTSWLRKKKNAPGWNAGGNATSAEDDVLETPPVGYVLTSALPKSPAIGEREIDDAVSQILENERSVEVELLMPVACALGAKLYFKGTNGNGFLHQFNPDGALARALGKKFANWGAVLSTVNGTKITSASDFKEMKEKVGKDENYRLRLLCYDGVDLSEVDRTRLVSSPRRQNGEKYPLQLHGKSPLSGQSQSNNAGHIESAASFGVSCSMQGTKKLESNAISNVARRKTGQDHDITSKIGQSGDKTDNDVPMQDGRKVIYLPYRMKPFGDHIFYEEDRFESDFMEVFRAEMRKEYPSKIHNLQYSLTRDKARPDMYKFIASGDLIVVEELTKRAMAWNRFISATTKLDLMFKDPDSLVVEFSTKTTASLGISYLNVRNLSEEHRRRLDHGQPGVWFGISSNDGVFVQKLGREICSNVAAIISVDNCLVTREEQVHSLLSPEKKSDVTIAICVHKDTPLIRYRQGLKICPLKECEFLDKIKQFATAKRLSSPPSIVNEDNSFLEYPPPGFVPTSALPSSPPTNEAGFGEAIEKILKDERSVELELQLPSSGTLGAQLCYPQKSNGIGWLHRFRLGSALATVFGQAFGDCGAALLSVNGNKTYSVQQFQTEKDKTRHGQMMRLKLLCFDGIDLSTFDRSKLVSPPRRLNGQKYPMHLQPKLFISNDPGTQNFQKGAVSSAGSVGHSSTPHLNVSIRKKNASERNTPLVVSPVNSPRAQRTSEGSYGAGDDFWDDDPFHENENHTSRSPRSKRKVLSAIALSAEPPSKYQRSESKTGAKLNVSNGTIPKYQEFQKTFKTNEPLGAYFSTLRVDGRNICSVQSIQMGGQAFREKRIHQGTIVDAVVIGARRDPVRTSKQLKSLYERAKKLRSGLRLIFKNSETSAKDPAAVDKSWSHDGKWEGGPLGGWAGGADDPWTKELGTYQMKPYSVSAQSPTLEESSLPDDGPVVGDEIMIDTHVESDSEIASSRRRSVTFGPSRAKIIEPRGVQDQQLDPIDESTPSARLMDAVNNGTCLELINLLESGASQDSEVVEKGLQECYNEVKKKISATKRDGESEPVSFEFSDLNAKRKVLNFYVNSTLLLEKALNLEHWGSFELRVLNSDVRFLDGALRESLMVCGNIRIGSLPLQGGKMEKLGDLKPQSFCEFIIWDENVNAKVKFTNNPYIFEPRQLQIELFTYAVDDQSKKPDFLCAFQLPLTIISDGCPNYEPPAVIEIPVALPNDRVRSGELTVEVQRVRTDHNYVRRKSDEVAFKLSEQLDFIARFNQDYKDELVLAPNIQGRNGKSMLHAAVHLRKLSLIKKLSDLGARFPPNAGETEDPLIKATNQRDRARKKLQEKEESGGVDENAVRAYRDSLAEFETMVDILTDMASKPLVT